MNEADALGALLGKGHPRAAAEAQPPAPATSPAAPADAPATGSKRFWPIMALGVVVSALWIFAAVRTLEKALIGGQIGTGMNSGQIDLLANGVVFTGLLLIALVLARLTPVAPRPRLFAAPLALAIGLIAGMGGMLLALLHAWIGNHAIASEVQGSAMTASWLFASLMTLFAAAVEEVIFRGWLQRRLTPRIGGAGAVVVAALAFSALHVFGGARSTLSLINIFLAGLFFGLLLWRTGSLWCSVGAHFAWNWSEVELLGLDPNPGRPPNGSVFDFDLIGPGIWGGSPEGLNASLPVTIVMVALILPLLVMRSDEQAVAPTPTAPSKT